MPFHSPHHIQEVSMRKPDMFGSAILFAIMVFWALPALAQHVDTAWVRRYNGPGNKDDRARAIDIDDLGNVYVAGYSRGSGTWDDYATIKYYPNGDTAWVRRYNGPGTGWDFAYALAIDDSANVYVTGGSGGSGTSKDYATIKYDTLGNELWVGRYNGPGNSTDEALAVVVESSGDVYVTGWSIGSGTSPDYATIRYYAHGDTAWVRRYNGPGNASDYARAIALDGCGYVYVTGESYGGSGTWEDYTTIKYGSSGDTAWVRRYNGLGNRDDRAYAMAVDSSGCVFVTGSSHGSGTHSDYATVKYYPNGDTAWVRRYNGPASGEDEAYGIALDEYNNVYITGRSHGSGTWDDYATIKYHPDGDTAWVRRYKGPGAVTDEARAIAVDGSGNVYVTGMSCGDCVTIKYYPNGDTGWVRRYNGPESSGDVARAIAVDDSNNVYLTGGSRGSGTGSDYATIKYFQYNNAPEEFSLLFPPNKTFTPRAVRFDWEDAGDPDPSDQVRYDLHVSPSYHSFPDSATVDSNLAESEFVKTLDYGVYYWKVRAKDNCGAGRWSDQIRCLMVTGIHCGDLNKDSSIDIGDVVFAISYLYRTGPSPDPIEAGEVNCDGAIDVGDVVYLVNYLYRGGDAPACP